MSERETKGSLSETRVLLVKSVSLAAEFVLGGQVSKLDYSIGSITTGSIQKQGKLWYSLHEGKMYLGEKTQCRNFEAYGSLRCENGARLDFYARGDVFNQQGFWEPGGITIEDGQMSHSVFFRCKWEDGRYKMDPWVFSVHDCFYWENAQKRLAKTKKALLPKLFSLCRA
ncbi:MAG: hypothetical protein Q7S34_03220 [bacterium]|nr:hypothetical protein [bacterium]